MLRVSIREFNRRMYFYLKNLPIIVFNKRTGEDLFIIFELKGGADFRDFI